MSINLQKSKPLIITNAIPTNLTSLLAQKSVSQSVTAKKPTKYLITLKARTRRTPNTKSSHTKLLQQPACRKFIIDEEDVLKGKSMFDSHYMVDNRKLERIDEQTVQSQNTITVENHNEKSSRSITDINRLTDDYSKKLSTKEDSLESTEQQRQTTLEELKQSVNSPNRLTGGCFRLNKKSDEYIKAKPPPEPRKPVSEFVQENGPSASNNEFFTKVTPTTDDANCKRIELLEEQIERMHMELKHIRNEIVPPEDLQKYSTLSERLNEINSLLLDLKLNCLHINDTSDGHNDKLKNSPCLRQFQQELPKIIIQSPKTDCREYGPEVCTNSHEPILEEAACKPNESPPCSGPILPRDYCKRTQKCRLANRNYYDNYSPDVNACTPRAAPRSHKYRPRQIFAEESESSESSLYDEANAASNWDVSPSNSAQWEPMATSTPHCQRPPQYQQQHRSCKQDNTRQSLPVTSSHRSYSEGKKRHSAPTTYERKCNRHQTFNQNDYPHPQTPRTFEQEDPFNHINRSSEPYAKQTSNQYHKRRRKSAGRESLFSSTDLSSPEVGARSNSKSYDATKPCIHADIPLVVKDLPKAIKKIIDKLDPENIALTVILESNNLYHITVSVVHTGQSLGCLYATEIALNHAERHDLFESYLTFFVLNSNNTLEQRNKMFDLLH